MGLEEYRRKRKFQETPEPVGSEVVSRPVPSPEPGSRFVVQMHHATRLHFDFRLEMDGVLKSWAVPKGPTLDPEQKRLAMMVEDHPVDYITFEGIIPAGNYGAGTVMVWDLGTYEPLYGKESAAMIEHGDLKFRLHGEKLNGEFALVRMKSRRPGSKGNEWLMLKKKDAYADRTWDLSRFDRSVRTGRTLVEIARDGGSDLWGKEKVPRAAQKAAARTIAMVSAHAADPAALPGARVADMPKQIKPMLAQTAAAPPEGPDWLTEIKWDGVRAIAYFGEDDKEHTIRLVSRKLRDITAHYPDLLGIGKQLAARRAILDGEIVCLESSGRASFEKLQQRMNLRAPDARTVAEFPVMYYAFDLLYLDGYDLRTAPLQKRKEALQAIIRSSGVPDDRLRFSDHHLGEGALLYELAKQQGLEGILAKRRQSLYREERTADWLKVKTTQTQDCVICGWTEPRGSRQYFGALILGLYQGKKLVFAGSVGTGFDERLQAAVWKELQELPKAKLPFAAPAETAAKPHWVKPTLVADVRFSEWTSEGRLRAPVFVGLRPDKSPEECVREEAVGPAPPYSPLFQKRKGEETVVVDGRTMTIKNLDKLFFSSDDYRKVDLIEYYFRISSYLLPYMKDKPVVMKRYPDGIAKPFFFQKDAGKAMPSWVRLEDIATGDGPRERTRFVICNDRPTLVYLANLGCIDHNLWQSHLGSLDRPDFILFDLDPGDKMDYSQLVEGALSFQEVFSRLGLEAFPKTSGAHGMHIYVPLEPLYTYEQARRFAEVVCHIVERSAPKLMTHERSLSKRPQDRIYLDYMQIGEGKTVPPPYCVRPHPGATVSTPLEWSEMKPSLDPAAFTIRTIWDRLAAKGDLFAGTLERLQRLDTAVEKLEGLT